MIFYVLVSTTIGRKSRKNKKGFIPLVSNAPKDHHSLLQFIWTDQMIRHFMYLVLQDNKKLKIKSNIFDEKVKFLNKKNLKT